MTGNTLSPTDGRDVLLSRRAVIPLGIAVGTLAVPACLSGLLWGGADGGATVTSIRGEPVELAGEGLYRYDTVFVSAGSQGTDLVTLAAGIPLLLIALVLYRRGSRRGGILLAGAMAYFTYVYASRALSNAYNDLFLLYVVLFSASLFGLLCAVGTFEFQRIDRFLFAGQSGRGLFVFLFGCAGLTAMVWLLPLLAALASGQAPELLDTYATSVTDVLDLGILVPTLVVAAVGVRRGRPFGYLLGSVLIVLLVLIAASIIAGTLLQVAAGVSFSAGQVIGPISGFLILAGFGLVLLVRILRAIAETPASNGGLNLRELA